MNKRDYKEFGAGEWYHVYNRGNDKMLIFYNPADFAVFLNRLVSSLKDQNCQRAPLTNVASEQRRVRIKKFDEGTFTIGAYCLMPNHFHLLIQQNTKIPISMLLLSVLTSYSKYFNRKYGHVGHVFQDRFKAAHVSSNTQLLHLSAYIHQNPKVARIVKRPGDWKYSSYREYADAGEAYLCDTSVILDQFKSRDAYRAFVEDSFEGIRARKNVRELMIDIDE